MATHHRPQYSSKTAAETLQWMNAIADFIRRYKPLMDSHVVNFFKDRLWELVDEQWIECLRKEPVENLLRIPSGFVQDYWPASLQDFILKLRSLALPRERKSSHVVLPNLHVAPLGSVLAQGMNSKKKHEVEIMAAVVKAIAHGLNAHTVIDVGSGQGYLAQALSFEYQLSVIAIDASMHHSSVTAARAERIKKHYAAKLIKSDCENLHLKVPQVVTCHVLSSDTLTALSTSSCKLSVEQINSASDKCDTVSSLVLAGLHACGDLSVSMLRTFVNCDKVKALVGIGCCYNLLSEESFENGSSPCGFPMSTAAKLSKLNLGKNARDLACQSAERWRNLTQDAALQNFEIHAFRAAFQLVLDKYYPRIVTSSPSIGRQGKALRRQQLRRSIESRSGVEESDFLSSDFKEDFTSEVNPRMVNSDKVKLTSGPHNDALGTSPRDETYTTSKVISQSKFNSDVGCKNAQSLGRSDKHILFKEFTEMGLSRLSLKQLQDMDMLEIWNEAQPFSEFIGPYWSLRAALSQLIETYILLDRLLFLQERGSFVEAFLFPIFDPTISPRNVAIIARKLVLDA